MSYLPQTSHSRMMGNNSYELSVDGGVEKAKADYFLRASLFDTEDELRKIIFSPEKLVEWNDRQARQYMAE